MQMRGTVITDRIGDTQMATLQTFNNEVRIVTTIQELSDLAGWHNPNDWGMLGPQEWIWDEVIHFIEREDHLWYGFRQADDREWYVCFEEGVEQDDLPPIDGRYKPSENSQTQGSDYTITIDYVVGSSTDWTLKELGRMSPTDVLEQYADWLQQQLEKAFPNAESIDVSYNSPNGRGSLQDHINIGGAKDDEQEEEILERIKHIVLAYEYDGVVDVPTLEELQVAPYLYNLPSDIVRKVVAGEDPFDADGDNSAIRTAMQDYDPDEPLSDIAIIRKRIAESHGELEYLWDVCMTSLSIQPRGVHEPFARALKEGLNPRPIYDAWEVLQELAKERNQADNKRSEYREQAYRYHALAAVVEGGVAEQVGEIVRITERIADAVDSHRQEKSPQWDAYRSLAAEAKEKNREELYHRILATFEQYIELGDPRVRRSGSGNPVFVDDAGKTVPPPGMGLGAGVEYCHTQWYVAEFEKRGIQLVELSVQ